MINLSNSLKRSLTKLALMLIVVVGITEYVKIGLSLINGTYTKAFIDVSPFSIGAGEKDSLPPEILEIKTIAMRNGLKTFSLHYPSYDESTKLFFRARALEFLYPIKIDVNSKYIFAIGEHEPLNACRAIDHLQVVTLYECTH